MAFDRDGEAVIDAHQGGQDLIKAQRKVSKGGKLVPAKSSRRGRHTTIAPGTVESTSAPRMTALTLEVLTTVANLNGQQHNPSNREIAQAAKVKDEGQISKLLARLENHGLLRNIRSGHRTSGNAWQLTARGERLLIHEPPTQIYFAVIDSDHHEQGAALRHEANTIDEVSSTAPGSPACTRRPVRISRGRCALCQARGTAGSGVSWLVLVAPSLASAAVPAHPFQGNFRFGCAAGIRR